MSAFESISTPPAAPPPSVTVNVGRPRARLVGGIVGTAILCGLSWYAGGSHERGRLDAMVAEERRVAEVERIRQADALRDVQAASDLRAEQAQSAADDANGRIESYVAQLQHRPVDARCTLTGADLRGLRDFAPGSAAPRPHRRPARAAEGAEVVR